MSCRQHLDFQPQILHILDAKLFFSILFLLGVIIPLEGFCQREYVDRINEYNDKGQKDGYWIEDGFRLVECYYKDGIKDGICKTFSPNRNLTFFSAFKEGLLTGPLYHFGDKGHLILIQDDFTLNDFPITIEGKKQIPPNRCYTINFHPNGRAKSEGILLYYEDSMLDNTFEYGEWKYYDESGNLIETKNFQ